MDTPTQPSFIPKKPIGISNVHASGSWLGVLLFLIASIVLIASLVAGGGAFLYERYLNSSITSKSATLQQTEAAFDPSTIQDLVRLDSRITNAKALLQKHITALGVFNFLSQETLQKVQFTGFTYDVQDDGTAQISLVGQADGFATVALQSDQFDATNTPLSDVVFSGVSVATNGQVGFNVKATVDPSLISYAKNLSSAPATSVTPVSNASSSPPVNSQ